MLTQMRQLAFVFLILSVIACVVSPGQASPTPAVASPTPPPTAGSTPIAANFKLTLAAPRQLMHADQPDALGMQGIPDQPLTPLLQPDHSYWLFIAGGDIGGSRGGPGLIRTQDFVSYGSVYGNPQKAQQVFTPSCRDNARSCADNYDADYAGPDLVFPASHGQGLVMLYQGTTTNFGGGRTEKAFYSVVALATSTDHGATWTRQGPVITGSDPKPSANPRPGANGADQSGAIVANGYLYDFYPYFPSRSPGGPTIEAARAPLSSDGAPGTWIKFNNGAFGSEPGLGGQGEQVVPSVAACTRPVQPWLAHSTYLNAYVMVFICQQGWFWTTSTDLTSWAAPIQFFTAPAPMFSNGQETDENISLVTPGNPSQEIGQSGYVLYANTPAWGKAPHMLWMRPFTFAKS
jgi:hypothetical protein